MRPLCDLVLLTWNRPDLLIPCVQRLLQHTTVPSRLLIVDNASTDPEALAFLSQVRGTDHLEVLVVRRAADDGFSIGMNDGIRRTTAPWVGLLSNDILVTEGWLEELVAVAQANPVIGLLNPMSNEFGIGPVDPEAIDSFSRSRRDKGGRWIEHYAGIGFCLFMPRAVLERVGGFDEQFHFMFFEDLDYSLRVRQAGWVCAIAEGAYVFHRRHATSQHHPQRLQLMRENEARFYHKWNTERPRRLACIVSTSCLRHSMSIYESLRRLANDGHGIYVYTTRRAQSCIPRHLSVTTKRLSAAGFVPEVLVRVLSRKKRFQRVMVFGRVLTALLRMSRPLHRAEVSPLLAQRRHPNDSL